MKFKNPFGLQGSLEVDGSFKIGKQSGKFSSSSSGDFVQNVPIPWEPGEIHVVIDVEYELVKVGGVDFWDTQAIYMGSGKFGVAANWRIIVTDDEMELKPVGSGPSGQTKSDNDIKVAAASALLTESSPREKKVLC